MEHTFARARFASPDLTVPRTFTAFLFEVHVIDVLAGLGASIGLDEGLRNAVMRSAEKLRLSGECVILLGIEFQVDPSNSGAYWDEHRGWNQRHSAR